jgi:hypothetical protein
MHVGKWERSPQEKNCKACDKIISPVEYHLHAKFGIETIDPGINRIVVMRLCQKCVLEISTLSRSPQDVIDDSV